MNINTPMKCIVALIAIAMIFTLFLLFDWQNKWKDVESLDGMIAQKEQDYQSKKEQVKELPILTKRKAELEAKLAQVVQTNLVPEKAEMFVANYIKEIEKLTLEEQDRMGDNTFEIVSITPGVLTSQSPVEGESSDEEAEGDGAPEALKQFPTRMFQMSMKGRYSTLVDFLYQLGALRLERLVTINKIALSPSSKEEGTSPTLSISIPITAYMRQGG
ncbi:MAG: type 4a pilus biogenesis protein PilO [bacterium]|nr:type 4a pilus biogenesis protein PilO [bacterium]